MTSYGRGEFEPFSSYQSGPSRGGQDAANEFTRLSQAVSNNIQKVTQNVAQLQRYVTQIGTSQDSEQLRERVHQTQHYTQQLAKETNKNLTDLARLPQAGSQSEQKQRKMQRERLMEEFTNSLKNFQTAQRSTAEKEKASIKRARAHSSTGKSPFEEDDKTSDDNLVSPGFSQTKQFLQMEEDVDLSLIEEREQSIKKLESDIMDVNQIFKDLGMLVHDQGEQLDSIEANVETAEIQVQEGTHQLSKARDYQSKARRKKCILLIIVLIVLAIIGVIIAVAVSN